MHRIPGLSGHRRRTSSNALPVNPNNGHSSHTGEGSWTGTGGAADAVDSGSAPLSTSAYARKCRELIDLDRALRALGEQSAFGDFPRITVIGGQSAGKSSVIEGISGITLPRGGGDICTRCPMEVSLSTPSTDTTGWFCTIKLRIGPDLKTFGPSPITDKSTVELWLRRAQAAILSPHRYNSLEWFYDKSYDQIQELHKPENGDGGKMLKFSKNVIVVDVYDPEGTHLSFVDLPGLISNAPDNDVQLIERLIKANIKGKNNIILMTLPNNADIETLQVAKMARNEDTRGRRTIGVITKTDALKDGDVGLRARWGRIFIGEESNHRLRHGYFAVRLADDNQRTSRVSREEMKQISDQFFASTEPWRDMDEPFRARLGITNLTEFLSKLLIELIEASLPKLRQTIERLWKELHEELSTIPPRFDGDPYEEILRRIISLCTEIDYAIKGREEYEELIQANKRHYNDYMRSIRSTCPNFRAVPSPTSSYSNIIRHPHPQPPLPSPEDENAGELNPLIYLEDVQRTIESKIVWHLPGHTPYEVILKYVKDFASNWKAPSEICMGSVVATTRSFIGDMVHERFKQFKILEDFLANFVVKKFDRCEASSKDEIRRVILEPHTKRPYWTQNNHHYTSVRDRWQAKYNDQCPVMGWESEITVMSSVRAYFQVAYKRVIDDVPLAIENRFNETFLDGLLEGLLSELKTKTSEELRDLMKEDPEITQKRRSLEEKIERLKVIREKLDAIYPPGHQNDHREHDDDDDDHSMAPGDTTPPPPLPRLGGVVGGIPQAPDSIPSPVAKTFSERSYYAEERVHIPSRTGTPFMMADVPSSPPSLPPSSAYYRGH